MEGRFENICPECGSENIQAIDTNLKDIDSGEAY